MSSKPTRSPSAVQASRASVTEKVRRNGGAGSGKQNPGQRSKTQRRSGPSGPSPARKRTPMEAKAKKAGAAVDSPARSTHVIVARIDPVSVLKLSALFYLSLCLALFIAGVLLWTGARASGLVANIEGFMDELGFTDFRLQTGQLLGASALASVVLVVAGSTANLLMALLYNLIGDVVGGLKVVLLQDRESPKR